MKEIKKRYIHKAGKITLAAATVFTMMRLDYLPTHPDTIEAAQTVYKPTGRKTDFPPNGSFITLSFTEPGTSDPKDVSSLKYCMVTNQATKEVFCSNALASETYYNRNEGTMKLNVLNSCMNADKTCSASVQSFKNFYSGATRGFFTTYRDATAADLGLSTYTDGNQYGAVVGESANDKWNFVKEYNHGISETSYYMTDYVSSSSRTSEFPSDEWSSPSSLTLVKRVFKKNSAGQIIYSPPTSGYYYYSGDGTTCNLVSTSLPYGAFFNTSFPNSINEANNNNLHGAFFYHTSTGTGKVWGEGEEKITEINAFANYDIYAGDISEIVLYPDSTDCSGDSYIKVSGEENFVSMPDFGTFNASGSGPYPVFQEGSHCYHNEILFFSTSLQKLAKNRSVVEVSNVEEVDTLLATYMGTHRNLGIGFGNSSFKVVANKEIEPTRGSAAKDSFYYPVLKENQTCPKANAGSRFNSPDNFDHSTYVSSSAIMTMNIPSNKLFTYRKGDFYQGSVVSDTPSTFNYDRSSTIDSSFDTFDQNKYIPQYYNASLSPKLNTANQDVSGSTLNISNYELSSNNKKITIPFDTSASSYTDIEEGAADGGTRSAISIVTSTGKYALIKKDNEKNAKGSATLDLSSLLTTNPDGTIPAQTINLTLYEEVYYLDSDHQTSGIAHISEGTPITIAVSEKSGQILNASETNPVDITYGSTQQFDFNVIADGGSATADDLVFTIDDEEKATIVSSTTAADKMSGSVSIRAKSGSGSVELSVTKPGNDTIARAVKKVTINLKKKNINLKPDDVHVHLGDSVQTYTLSADASTPLADGDTLPAGYRGTTSYVTSDGKYMSVTPAEGAVIGVSRTDSEEVQAFETKYAVSYGQGKLYVTMEEADASWFDIPEANANGWHKEAVVIAPSAAAADFTKIKQGSADGEGTPVSSITLTTSLAASGSQFTFYKDNGGYSSTIALPSDINIDMVAPVEPDIQVTPLVNSRSRSILNAITGDHFFKDGFHVEITGEDALSGMDSISALDHAQSVSCTGSGTCTLAFNVTSDFNDSISGTLSDKAGNTLAFTSDTIINETPDQDGITISGTSLSAVNKAKADTPAVDTNDPVTYYFNVKAPHSGIQKVEYGNGDSWTLLQEYNPVDTNDPDFITSEKAFSIDMRDILRAAPLGSTQYVMNIRVTSNAGNVKEYPFSTWYDVTNPVIATPEIENPDTHTKTDKKVTFTINEMGSKIDGLPVVTLDGSDTLMEVSGENDGQGETIAYSFIAGANGTYRINAADKYGNHAVEQVVNIDQIDTTAPVISSPVYTPDMDTISASRTITFDVSDTLDSDAYNTGINASDITIFNTLSPDNVPELTCTGSDGNTDAVSCSFTISKDGTYTVNAIDRVGNETTSNITITNMDDEAPVLGAVSGNTGITEDAWAQQRTVEIAFTDNGASATFTPLIKDIHNVDKTTELNTQVDTVNKKISFTTTKNETYTITLRDEANNVSDAITVITNHIDADEPTISTTRNNEGANKVQSVTLSAEMVARSGINTLKLHYSSEENGTYTDTLVSHRGKPGVSRTYLADKEVSENGWYYYSLVNGAGASATGEKLHITNIDNTALTTTVTPQVKDSEGNWISYDQGWTNREVRLSLTSDASETTGTNTRYEVKIDDGEWRAVTDTSITINTLTNSAYQFRTISESGVEGIPSAAIQVRFDNTKPETPAITDVDAYDAWFSYNRTISAAFNKKDGAQRDETLNEHLMVSVDGVNWSEADSFTPSTQGTYAVRFKVVDAAGNESDACTPVDLKIDSDTPEITLRYERSDSAGTLNALTGGLFFNDTMIVHVEVSNASVVESGIASYEHRLIADGSEASTIHWTSSTNDTFTIDDEFKGDLEVKVTSNAHNEEHQNITSDVTRVENIMRETTKPSITFTGNTEGWTNDTAVQIALADSNGTYRSDINLNASYYHITPSGEMAKPDVTFTEKNATLNLADDGVQTIFVHAQDKAGNIQEESTTVKIDTIAPDITIAELDQSTWAKSRTITFTVTEDGSGFAGAPSIRRGDGTLLDASAFTWNADTKSGSFTTDEMDTYTISIDDIAGNTGTASKETINIDTQDITITNIANTGSGDDPWVIDNRTITFAVEAGAAGISGIPVITKDGAPVRVTDETAADNTTTTYSYSFVADSEGDYEVHVVGNNTSIHDETIHATRFDDTAVVISAVSEPDMVNPVQSATFTFDITQGASGLSGFKVYFTAVDGVEDSGTDINLKNGHYEYKAKANGTYRFHALNNAGGYADKSYTLSNIENNEPLTVISATDATTNEAYDGTWTNHNIAIALSNANTAGTTTYEVKAPGGEWRAVSDPDAYVIETDTMIQGTWQFRATSQAGVVEEEVKSITIRIDKELPSTPIITNASAYGEDNWYSYEKAISATFTAKSGRDETFHETLQVSSNGTDWSNASTWTPSSGTTGEHTISFRVIDSAGNISSSSTGHVNIDHTLPDVTLQYEDNEAAGILHNLTMGSFYKNTLQVKATVNNEAAIASGIRGYQFQTQAVNASYKDASWGSMTTSNTYPIDPQFHGSVHAQVMSNAELENRDEHGQNYIHSVSSVDDIMVENERPSITFEEHSNAWTSTNTISFTMEDNSDIASGIDYTNSTYRITPASGSAGSDIAISQATTSLTLNDGEQSILVHAQDKAGNDKEESITMKVDTFAPVITPDALDQSAWSQSRTITYTVQDATSGLDGAPLVKDVDGKTITSTFDEATHTGSFIADKNGDYTITSKDKAGNTADKTITISKLDNQTPVIQNIENTGTADDIWYSDARTITFEVAVGESGLRTKPVVAINGTPLLDAQLHETKDETQHVYSYSFTTSTNAAYTINATGGSGKTASEAAGNIAKIDKVTPAITLHNTPDFSTTAKNLTFEFEVTAGDSGLQDVTVWFKPVDGTETLLESLSAMDGIYTYKAAENGDYRFTATSNAQSSIDGTHPSASYTKTVTNISNTDPLTTMEAFTLTEDGKEHAYVSKTWTNSDVHIRLGNLRTGAGHGEDTRYEVNINEQKNGSELVWNDITDHKDDYIITSDAWVSNTYAFRAVSGSGTADTDTVKHITINLDKETPSTPVFAHGDHFTSDDWYSFMKTAQAQYQAKNNRPDGFKEMLEMKLDDGEWRTCERYTPDAQGTHALKFRVVDSAGNISDVLEGTLNIDSDQPSLRAEYKKNDAVQWLNLLTGNLFYNDTIEVSMQVTNQDDIESGIHAYSYLMNGIWKTTPDGRFAISPDFGGDITMKAESNALREDGSYNAVTHTAKNVFIEKTAPSIQVSAISSSWSKQNRMTIRIAEEGSAASGIDPSASWIYINNHKQSLKEGEQTFTLPDGEYTMIAHAADRSGNVNERRMQAKIDTQKPVLELDSIVTSGTQRTITFHASDALSGIDSAQASVGLDQMDITWKGDTGTFTTDGYGALSIFVSDKAGNIQGISRVLEAIQSEETPLPPTTPEKPITPAVPQTPQVSDKAPSTSVSKKQPITQTPSSPPVVQTPRMEVQTEDKTASITVKDGTAFDSDVVLNIIDRSDDKEERLVKAKNEMKQQVLGIWEIKLSSNDTQIQPDGSIIVKLKLDDLGVKEKNVKVYRLDDSGETTEITSRIEDGYLIYETEELGAIILVDNETTPMSGGKKASPSDNTAAIVTMGVTAVAAGAGAIGFYLKSGRRKKVR